MDIDVDQLDDLICVCHWDDRTHEEPDSLRVRMRDGYPIEEVFQRGWWLPERQSMEKNSCEPLRWLSLLTEHVRVARQRRPRERIVAPIRPAHVMCNGFHHGALI